MKRFLSVCVLLLLLVPAACAGASERFSVVYTDTFDTVISLVGFAESRQKFDEISALAHSTYQHLHRLYDRYNEYEDVLSLCAVNRLAKEGPVEVDPLLFSLLSFAKSQYSLGQGQTNVALGRVLSLWHVKREAGLADPGKAQLPEMDALKEASRHCSIEDLVLDPEHFTVAFADPEMELDVGAVAKGYATEVVARLLEAAGMSSYVLSAGGNVRIGHPPLDGRPNWAVGLQTPDGSVADTDIVDTLYLSDCSVVTSGDYQRYYEVDGKRYCHLIDPDTLMPGEYFRSVTIITGDSGLADFLSTAAFLMPYSESRAFVESLPDVEAVWLMPDGQELMTEGIRKSAKSQGAVNKRR